MRRGRAPPQLLCPRSIDIAAFRDNRQFTEALARTGDVITIKQEVDWDLEVGAIVRRSNERGGPAVLFDRIKDYPPGYRILGTPLATYRRLAIAMGLDPVTPVQDIQATYESRLEHPLKPVLVDRAPCQQNKLLGEEVDLYRFPSPMIHEGDGGRFIGTWHAVISTDPDTRWTNWGMYRVMVHSRRYVAGTWRPGQHIGMALYGKYVPNHQAMPVAIAIGVDPLCSLAALSPLEAGLNEADYAGALRGEPVELVKCHTSDLLVPAHAEIVLEGEILPDVRIEEGPMGEYTGYRVPGKPKEACVIKAITFRDDPILTMTCMGTPTDDCVLCTSVAMSVAEKKRLLRHGLPVTTVHMPIQGAQHVLVVATRNASGSTAEQIKKVIHSQRVWHHIIIVVDDDVDVFDLPQVLHSLATKCHPVRGVKLGKPMPAMPLTPNLSPQEREQGIGPSVLFDCTWPAEWSKERDVPPRASFDDMYPKEVKDKVIRNWSLYGFTERG